MLSGIQEVEFRQAYYKHMEGVCAELQIWREKQIAVMKEIPQSLDFSMEEFAHQSFVHIIKKYADEEEGFYTAIKGANDIINDFMDLEPA
jgi:hypothetical protein